MENLQKIHSEQVGLLISANNFVILFPLLNYRRVPPPACVFRHSGDTLKGFFVAWRVEPHDWRENIFTFISGFWVITLQGHAARHPYFFFQDVINFFFFFFYSPSIQEVELRFNHNIPKNPCSYLCLRSRHDSDIQHEKDIFLLCQMRTACVFFFFLTGANTLLHGNVKIK